MDDKVKRFRERLLALWREGSELRDKIADTTRRTERFADFEGAAKDLLFALGAEWSDEAGDYVFADKPNRTPPEHDAGASSDDTVTLPGPAGLVWTMPARAEPTIGRDGLCYGFVDWGPGAKALVSAAEVAGRADRDRAP